MKIFSLVVALYHFSEIGRKIAVGRLIKFLPLDYIITSLASALLLVTIALKVMGAPARYAVLIHASDLALFQTSCYCRAKLARL